MTPTQQDINRAALLAQVFTNRKNQAQLRTLVQVTDTEELRARFAVRLQETILQEKIPTAGALTDSFMILLVDRIRTSALHKLTLCSTV